MKIRAKSLIDRLRDAKVEPSHYGLIHADVYQDNLRILDGGGLELFDFDNCEYGWLISDVATALYAALWREPAEAKHTELARRFIESFLRGYEREHHLPDSELCRLNDWLPLRDVLIYTVSCK